MKTTALIALALAVVATNAAAQRKPPSVEELKKTTAGEATKRLTLDAEHATVFIDVPQIATADDEQHRGFEALVEPQDHRFTGDDRPASGQLVQENSPSEAHDYPGTTGNHIRLDHGWVVVSVSSRGGGQNRESGGGGENDETRTGGENDESRGRGPVGSTDRPKPVETSAEPQDYPVTTVRSIGAGAEGTDLLVAVTRLWEGANPNHAEIILMHVGGALRSRVWLCAPNPDGGPNDKYQTARLSGIRGNRTFLAIRVENYFDDDTKDQHGVIEYRSFADHPEMRELRAHAFQQIKNEDDRRRFFRGGRRRE